MEINDHTVKVITDPTGLIEGERYEFRLYITLDEDDELYQEGGIGVRAILAVDEGKARIAMSHFFECETENVLEYSLEDDETDSVLQFCKENLPQ